MLRSRNKESSAKTRQVRPRDEALTERDELRIELDSVHCQTDALTQKLHREISEQCTAHEQRVEALNEAVATARTRLAEQRSQLDALKRENTNLTTLNNRLSVRIDKTQSTLASTEARLLALNAQRTAEQREWEALQAMITARFAEKDKWIDTLPKRPATRMCPLRTTLEASDRLGW